MSDLTSEQFNELKIHFALSIGFAGADQSDCDPLSDYIDYETWLELDEKERERFINDIAEEWSGNYIDLAGWVK